MKIVMIRMIGAVIAGLLLSNPSMAAQSDIWHIQQKCDKAAYQLNRLAESNPRSVCSGDVKIAAAYIEAARLELQFRKIEQAQTSIKYSELELKAISSQRDYCTEFSHLVKPFIAETILIGSEIEVIARLNK